MWQAQLTTPVAGYSTGTVLQIKPDPEVNYQLGLTMLNNAPDQFLIKTSGGANIAVIHDYNTGGTIYLPWASAVYSCTVVA